MAIFLSISVLLVQQRRENHHHTRLGGVIACGVLADAPFIPLAEPRELARRALVLAGGAHARELLDLLPNDNDGHSQWFRRRTRMGREVISTGGALFSAESSLREGLDLGAHVVAQHGVEERARLALVQRLDEPPLVV